MKEHASSQAKVQILPETLSNQIAAGEVVERPASVIKELIENALDAGAKRIFVEVQDGGRKQIRVIDNGHGMTREDATLAVLRHATSKIRNEKDLHSIGTLGFRGEALPSIASVSRFRLVTRTSDTSIGTQLDIAGGNQQELSDAGCPIGTTITIEDLFYNVPARLKFMKGKATEMGHINQLVTGFALGHPDVHFRLTNNGRKTADYPCERNLKSRIYSVLGGKACARLYETHLDADILIHGFTSEPAFSKGGTQGIYTFINGRQVRDKLLLRAISTSYGTLLERGRYPHAVLYLTVPPDWVDVNVHPTKHEVRFVHGGRVFECVCRALKMTLDGAPWTQGDTPQIHQNPASNLHLWSQHPPPGASTQERVHQDASSMNPTSPSGSFGSPHPGRMEYHRPGEARGTGTRIGDFIVTHRENDLVLLHRRRGIAHLTFMEGTAQYSSGQVLRQRLLFPEQFQVSEDITSWVSENQQFERLGFIIEPFGEKTLVLKEIPLSLAGTGQHVAAIDTILAKKITEPTETIRLIAKLASQGELNETDDKKLVDASLNGVLPAESDVFGKLIHICRKQDIERWFGGETR